MAVKGGSKAAKGGTASKSSKDLTATFNMEKETPGTVRYKEDAEKGSELIGTLYLKKAAAQALGNPDSVEVVVTAQ